jgi:predicted alpha/beta hydrolase
MTIGEFVLWFVLAHAIVWAIVSVWVFFFGDRMDGPDEPSGAVRMWKRWLGRSGEPADRSGKKLGW